MSEYLGRLINQLANKDQSLRKEDFKGDEKEKWQKIGEFDLITTKTLKGIVDKIGLPSISKVGKKASYNAWLLVQHSSDLEFQKRYLHLMQENVKDVDPKNIAYLEDRILMYQNKPQIYGTQVILNKDTEKYEPYELVDPQNVDKRRKEKGMEPLQEYMKMFFKAV